MLSEELSCLLDMTSAVETSLTLQCGFLTLGVGVVTVTTRPSIGFLLLFKTFHA